ncbi:phospholipase D-like domain-containing protein [Desulfuromonas sp. DDH964]|uniref:phospholipase D-like domain-containing protein n=1 Tax=Desulfuromonas sp. DDH964 TaxID=1823759 RepID=UPI00078EA8AC|nr:cardiolipin synthase [Desulfuromonas sp. DDH964]
MNPAKFTYPRRSGNQFRLLVDGDAFFPAMLEAIDRARLSVLAEFYLFESGELSERFIAALTAAAARGIPVYLLLDDFGSRLLLRHHRQQLLEAGVQLAFYNPLRRNRWRRNLQRNHRKLLLVDGELAFTGGAGITDLFSPALHPTDYWHELMLEIRGPLGGDWFVLFGTTWERTTGVPLTIPATAGMPLPGGSSGRVAAHGRFFQQSDIIRSLLKRVRRAKGRVWLATAYFLPSWKLRRALKRSARAGIDVRLLLPGPRTDHPSVRHLGRRHYESLLRAGVRIFEFQPRFLHAKVQLCDNWASIGSSNLDRWNLRWNLEANQELEDPELIGELVRLFTADFALCREIDLQSWLERPWWRRRLEQVWATVEALVRRISEPRPPGPPH